MIMKKTICLSVFVIACAVSNAQVKKIPPVIKAATREIVNRSTGHRGYSNVSIKVTLIQTEGKGETLQFTSSTAIEKAALSFAGIAGTTQQTTYNPDTKSGVFYLESAAYKDGQAKGYLIDFFVKGFDKPVWVCALTAKK